MGRLARPVKTALRGLVPWPQRIPNKPSSRSQAASRAPPTRSTNVLLMEHTSRRAHGNHKLRRWVATRRSSRDPFHSRRSLASQALASHHDVWDVHLADRRLWVITGADVCLRPRRYPQHGRSDHFPRRLSHRIMSNHQPPAGATRVMERAGHRAPPVSSRPTMLSKSPWRSTICKPSALARVKPAGCRSNNARGPRTRRRRKQPQLGNFLAWSERACEAWLPGKRNAHLPPHSPQRHNRRLAKPSTGLTHAQRATPGRGHESASHPRITPCRW